MVAGGYDGSKIVDTIEELQVHIREGYAHSNDPLRWTPPLKKLPSRLMDATHRGKVQRCLVKIEEQMREFAATVNARERELTSLLSCCCCCCCCCSLVVVVVVVVGRVWQWRRVLVDGPAACPQGESGNVRINLLAKEAGELGSVLFDRSEARQPAFNLNCFSTFLVLLDAMVGSLVVSGGASSIFYFDYTLSTHSARQPLSHH